MKQISCLLFLLMWMSCGEDIRSLDRRAKYKADSLFQYEYPVIIKTQDSICNLKKDMNKQVLLDSIVEIRKQEIIKLQEDL